MVRANRMGWTLLGGGLLLAGGMLVGSGGQAYAKFNLEHEHVPGQLIVKFKAKGGEKSLAAQSLLKGMNAKVKHVFSASGAVSLDLGAVKSEGALLAAAERLAADPAVAYVEANTILRADVDARFPNDPEFAQLYGMHNEGGTGGAGDSDIDAPEAWGISTGSRSVLVGIIDTGVDYSHPDIAANYWTNPGESGVDAAGADKKTNGVDDDGNGFVDDFRGWDFVNNDNDPMDDNNHGTHCAGTIGGAGDNGVGVAGVNWEVSIVGLKFLSGAGSGTLEDAVKAIEYATKLGVTLSSNSWGGGGFSDTMDAAIRDAEAHDILFIAAAGNSASNNDSSPHYPSSYTSDNIISVAATDHNDGIASFSCYGVTSVDVGAPGVDILSSVPGGTYTKYSGTSMATPHVAGLAALVKSVYPEATSAQIKARILNTADPVQSLAGKTVTGGRINAANSLENDSVAPNAVSGLAAGDATTSSISLRFNPAGDDGSVGVAGRYEIRFAATPIVDAASWNAATRANAVMGAADGAVTAVVSGLPFNYEGYVAVKASDNVGNVGPLSATVPFAVLRVTKVAENLADSMDGVTAEAPWGLEAAADGGSVFSDSPGAEYGTDADVEMVLADMAVTSPDVTLVVSSSIATEAGYDFGYIEASTDGGATWKQVDKQTGSSGGMVAKSYNLSTVLAGATTLRLRFRLTSDYSINGDGWKIDSVTLFAPAK